MNFYLSKNVLSALWYVNPEAIKLIHTKCKSKSIFICNNNSNNYAAKTLVQHVPGRQKLYNGRKSKKYAECKDLNRIRICAWAGAKKLIDNTKNMYTTKFVHWFGWGEKYWCLFFSLSLSDSSSILLRKFNIYIWRYVQLASRA